MTCVLGKFVGNKAKLPTNLLVKIEYTHKLQI